jgi:plastocyanin
MPEGSFVAVDDESGLGAETIVVVHVDLPGRGDDTATAISHAAPEGDRLYLLVPEEHEGGELLAGRVLGGLLEQLRRAGHDAEGQVGDYLVLDSLVDVLGQRSPRQIIVVTPPLGLPDRLHLDLAHRVTRAFGVPTTHVVVPGASWSGSLDLSIGAGYDAARHRPHTELAGTAMSLPAWATRAMAVVVVVLLVGLVVTVAVGLHQASVDKRRALIAETAPATTLTVLAGTPDPNGPTREYSAFFPSVVKVHAGDTVAFYNPTADVPHTVTFGIAADRSNQPVFGGAPLPVVVGPCASNAALTKASRTCGAPSGGALPSFDGQAFYSSGIVAPRQQFLLRTATNLRPGTYHYYCLIHSFQVGTIIVEPPGTATQLHASVDRAARRQQRRDAATLADLPQPSPPPGVVQAGVTGAEASLNQFFPSTIHIQAGQPVTWMNTGGTPHVIIFAEYVDPNSAGFSSPTAPSGSDYAGGAFISGPIGAPAYPSTSFTLRFTKPGTYAYICSFHPGMGGTVVVGP